MLQVGELKVFAKSLKPVQILHLVDIARCVLSDGSTIARVLGSVTIQPYAMQAMSAHSI